MAKKKAKQAAGKSKAADELPWPKDRANTHLSDEFLVAMRDELLKRKALLGQNINSELDEMRDGSGEHHHLADMEDLGGDASDEELSLKVLEMGSDELEQIAYALKRIENGTYGICEDTEQPIRKERLEALPYATLSIDAQRRREREEMGY